MSFYHWRYLVFRFDYYVKYWMLNLMKGPLISIIKELSLFDFLMFNLLNRHSNRFKFISR